MLSHLEWLEEGVGGRPPAICSVVAPCLVSQPLWSSEESCGLLGISFWLSFLILLCSLRGWMLLSRQVDLFLKKKSTSLLCLGCIVCSGCVCVKIPDDCLVSVFLLSCIQILCPSLDACVVSSVLLLLYSVLCVNALAGWLCACTHSVVQLQCHRQPDAKPSGSLAEDGSIHEAADVLWGEKKPNAQVFRCGLCLKTELLLQQSTFSMHWLWDNKSGKRTDIHVFSSFSEWWDVN